MLLPPILLALSLCSPALQEASESELDADTQAAIDGIFSAYDTPDQAGMSVAVARDGIKGRVVGNTCERLLDQTHSDLLVLN